VLCGSGFSSIGSVLDYNRGFGFDFKTITALLLIKSIISLYLAYAAQINLRSFSKTQHGTAGRQLSPISVNQQTYRARRIERRCAFELAR